MYKPRVLIAEDSHTDQYVIRRMLEQLNCLVDIVDNGFEAVDAVRRQSYDLVLMDQLMPILNGIEAARIIRELPGMSRLPIVAITRDLGLCQACLQAGMDDFLVKPVAQYKFSEILHKHVPAYGAPAAAQLNTGTN